MQLKHWLTLGFTAAVIAGCSEGRVAQPSETSAVAPASSEVAQAAETIEKSGRFISGEHPTQGTVRLVARNGQAFLELGQDFETSSLGPDLVVILHRSNNVIGSTHPPSYPIHTGDYVILAPLQAFKGAQSYPIPGNVNLADYQSAGIWCRQFNATFGAAVLQPAVSGSTRFSGAISEHWATGQKRLILPSDPQ